MKAKGVDNIYRERVHQSLYENFHNFSENEREYEDFKIWDDVRFDITKTATERKYGIQTKAEDQTFTEESAAGQRKP